LPPSPSPAPVGETVTDTVAIEPVAASGKPELDAAASGAGLIPEVEGVVAASNLEEAELAAADTALGGEITTPEVRDPLDVQGTSELPDLDFDVLHDCRSGSSVPEEAGLSGAASTSGPTWWGTVGSQGRSSSYSSPPNRGMNCYFYCNFGLASEIWVIY
jgi:hypothetical protein